ncbi:filamentous hemagglutinin, partial [Pseudomonas fluorescens WH6]
YNRVHSNGKIPSNVPSVSVSNSSPVTIDTGHPLVTVLSEAAAASPFGFFPEAGTSSTCSCLTKTVR